MSKHKLNYLARILLVLGISLVIVSVIMFLSVILPANKYTLNIDTNTLHTNYVAILSSIGGRGEITLSLGKNYFKLYKCEGGLKEYSDLALIMQQFMSKYNMVLYNGFDPLSKSVVTTGIVNNNIVSYLSKIDKFNESYLGEHTGVFRLAVTGPKSMLLVLVPINIVGNSSLRVMFNSSPITLTSVYEVILLGFTLILSSVIAQIVTYRERPYI